MKPSLFHVLRFGRPRRYVGYVRHVGFEDDTAAGFAKTRDVNGIEWEQIFPAEQDRRIEETYGTAIRQTANR
jgi:hypothetical protein